MHTPLYLASVLALGVAAQWVAWRFRLPAIVLLLAFGVLLGQFGPQLDTAGDHQLFFAFVSLAVGIILFEGGLSLDFRELEGTHGVVLRLVTVGLVITWLVTAWLAHHLAGFSGQMSLLLGALLTVSGPTVILPLLRHVQPVRKLGSLAKWEGIVNDPIGAVLAALVFELLIDQTTDSIAIESLWSLGQTLLYAAFLSGAAALVILTMLRRYWVPDFLQNPMILAILLVVFALSNNLRADSGLVTVTLLGVMLANQRKVAIRHIVEFKETLRTLLISTLFIVLAARVRVDANSLSSLGWGTAAFVVLLILVVRPVAVFVSTIGSGLNWRERTFMAWIHPRGIVAAAVSSLFALALVRHGEGTELALEADRFVLTTFLVIVGTVTVYGLTLAPLARWLGVSGENPQGILFAGASFAVREIAMAVQKEGIPVLLVDTNRLNNSTARMAGLPVAYGSIGSEVVHEEIDLGGIGRLLAMTPNDEVNTLAVMGFAERFGRAEVYQVASSQSGSDRAKRVTAYRSGRIVFDRPMTIAQLNARFAAGARLKKTTLTEDFTYSDFMDRYGESAIVLFALGDGGRLTVATDDKDFVPKAGQKLIALVDEVEDTLSANVTQSPPPASTGP